MVAIATCEWAWLYIKRNPLSPRPNHCVLNSTLNHLPKQRALSPSIFRHSAVVTVAMGEQLGGATKRLLLVLSVVFLTIGNCGGPLIMRLYFLRGGKRIWLSSWLQTAGWPIISIPLLASYFYRRAASPDAKAVLIKPRLFVASAVIGIITGTDNYLYAYGVARLPVSTSALIIASQLAFTAGFAFLLVKQKFSPYSINAVVLLTLGAGVLALHANGDRPNGESNRQYFLGFFMTLGAAVLYGFLLPLIELTYMKANQDVGYTLVMEIQMVMSFSATVFSTVGMLINNDFQAIPREASAFELGEARYYLVLVGSAIFWLCFFLGAIGVIFCASSLLSGILVAVLLPATEILGVIFYHEKFQAEKGVALGLSIWGFVSYFYGELKHSKKTNQRQIQIPEIEAAVAPTADITP